MTRTRSASSSPTTPPNAWHPWDAGDQVARGRAAIVKAWLDNRDAPGTYQGQYAPLAIDGDLAVAMGRSKYFEASGVLLREFDNCFVIRFDEQGRCTSFMSPWSTLKTTSS